MIQKNVCMEIKAEQFEVLENDKARQVDGGSDSNSRDSYNGILSGLSKIIDYFTGNK